MQASNAEFAQRFAEIVGPEHADFDAESLSRAFPSTGPSAHAPAGVVRPGSREQVVALVKAARLFGVALYPISRGRNWGYGDAAPSGPGQVIVDLSRLNQIRKIDERLAYAVIEPGVTQGELAAALEERGDKLWFDATGAGPGASIVGNVLERGFGHTAYGDRVRSVCGLEVVLGDGAVVRTGFSAVRESAVGAVYPYGIGPYLDGLFTQSGFGIVTEMTVWLMPAPDRFAAVVCQLNRHGDIGDFVDRLRALRLDGTLTSVVHVANDLRILSGRMRYPEERAGGRTLLPAALRNEICRDLNIAPWAFSAALYGDRAQVRAAWRRVRAALKGLDCRIHLVDDRKIAWGRGAAALLGFTSLGKRLRDQLNQIGPAVSLLKGKPVDAFLAGAYWRSDREPEPGAGFDPARDGCGLLWLGPVLPATGEDVRRLLDTVEPVFAAFGFDMLLTLSSVTARSLSAIMTVSFRKSDPAEAERAANCYRELVAATARAGYPAYRASSQMMDAVTGDNRAFWQTVSAVKGALDPDGLIAPGRYSFPKS